MIHRALFAFLIAASLHAQAPLPAFEAEALSGRKVIMPGAVNGHTAILVVCFTHASGPHCTEWTKRLAGEKDAEKYTVVFLEDAPRLVRGMAKSGIKSTVAKEDYNNYLIVTEHEKELKAAVHFQSPDEAYLLLLSPDAQILGTWHGTVSDAIVRQIHDLIPK